MDDHSKTLLWTTQDCGACELIAGDFHSGDAPRIRAVAHVNSQWMPLHQKTSRKPNQERA